MIENWLKSIFYFNKDELLPFSLRCGVVLIVGKAMSVVFRTASEEDVRIIQRKWKEMKQVQSILIQVVRENFSYWMELD